MRPVKRGASPQKIDYDDYVDAQTDLISRIGSGWINGSHISSYCSFCERVINTMLAVEHIEPKDGPHGKPYLVGKWTNFLLACVNCNSTKGAKKVILADVFLPDRDNTFEAFEYRPDGKVLPSPSLSASNFTLAENTLKLTGLDKEARETYDANGRLIAKDRANQRMQVWEIAEIARQLLDKDNGNEEVKCLIVMNAVAHGFFSVWMTVFKANQEIRHRLIDAFAGTRASECFDSITAESVSPAPNSDKLIHGGKV